MNLSEPQQLYYLETNSSTIEPTVVEEDVGYELPFGPGTAGAFGFAAGACAFACIFASLVVAGILCSRQARSESFNIYLVFLVIPDAMFNGSLAVTSSMFSRYMAVDRGEEFPPYIFRIYFWFNEFYYFCNILINAVVTREIFILLKNSNRRMRYSAPSTQKAFTQCMIVYIFVALNAFWKFLDVPWSLEPEIGAGNLPFNIRRPARTTSTLIISLYYFFFFFLPIVYVLYVNIYVKVKKLLPKSGRTRVLAFYFLRIIIVFMCCYIPYFLLASVGKNWIGGEVGFWLEFCFGDLFYPLQTYVTLFLVLTKPDVYGAFKSLLKKLCCLFCLESPADKKVAVEEKDVTGVTAEVSNATPEPTERESKSIRTEQDERKRVSKRVSMWNAGSSAMWHETDVYDDDDDENESDPEDISPNVCKNNDEVPTAFHQENS